MDAKLTAVAGGAKLTLSNGERFYADWTFPGRTFLCRVGPFGPIEPLVVPIEPKNMGAVSDLFHAYITDHPNCPGCGCIVDEPGFCDSVCWDQYNAEPLSRVPS